jgi:apolipoprotein N-acyltransferase
MGLTPAPLGLWGLAWIAQAPLWMLVRRSPCRPSPALLGLLWGMGYHGLALFWITGLHPLTWMGIPWLSSLGIAGGCWLLVTFWGAFLPALWASGMAGIEKIFGPQCPSWLRLGLGTALWSGLESVWAHSPLWWTSLSYTQSPANLVILHLGQLSGPVTVTAALVLVNGLLSEGVMAAKQPHNSGSKRAIALFGLALICFLGFHLIGWGYYRLPLADSESTALKVGIIQGNIPTRIKLSVQGQERARQAYRQGYESLTEQGVDAVLTPEGAFPVVWERATAWLAPFKQAVQERQRPVWVGSFGTNGENITQSLFTLNSSGQILSRYDKVKLVPLGEYIPFPEVLGKLFSRLSSLKIDMVPGMPGQRLDTPFGPAIAGICFDSAFAQLFQAQAAAGGLFILTAANNDPYSAVMMSQHHAQDVMRAIETDRWAMRATNTGYSSVVDPHGQTRWRSGVNRYQLHVAQIFRRDRQTLYVRWGDWLTPGLLLAGAIAIIANQSRGSTRHPFPKSQDIPRKT